MVDEGRGSMAIDNVYAIVQAKEISFRTVIVELIGALARQLQATTRFPTPGASARFVVEIADELLRALGP